MNELSGVPGTQQFPDDKILFLSLLCAVSQVFIDLQFYTVLDTDKQRMYATRYTAGG